jgi:hypothetical protein
MERPELRRVPASASYLVKVRFQEQEPHLHLHIRAKSVLDDRESVRHYTRVEVLDILTPRYVAM